MSTPDFFRSRLDAMLDQHHPLFILAERMPWTALAEAVASQKAAKEDVETTQLRVDLFGVSEQNKPRGSRNAGRPALSVRLLAGLLYLKHAFDESDETVCARWAENPYWQYFCGEAYFQPRLPCDPTKLVQFRQLLDEAGATELLAQTINTAVAIEAVPVEEFERVIVDSTVQEKAVAFPTDSRLLEVARHKLVKIAKSEHIPLKQTFAKEGKLLRVQAGRYAHAKQFKRMRKAIKRQRTIVRKLLRAVRAKTEAAARHHELLTRIERVLTQQPKDHDKIYALHAPEVECISKGKARQRYEFGVKTSVAITEKSCLLVGAMTFPGNPYDGHTLATQLEQTAVLLQDLPGQPRPKTAIVDLGYRGVCVDGVDIIHRGKYKSLNTAQRKSLKRRQAVEPIIGHLKDDCGLRRCWLKGALGDALHALLCAAGYNLRFLMRAIRFFCAWILCWFGRLIKAATAPRQDSGSASHDPYWAVAA
jgi:IS5 family transposase